MSPVGFPDAVVEPFAVFRVSGVVIAGRAGVIVDVVVYVTGAVRAGLVVHLAVLVLFVPVFVRRRSGERNGWGRTGGRGEGKNEEQNPTEAGVRGERGPYTHLLSSRLGYIAASYKEPGGYMCSSMVQATIHRQSASIQFSIRR